VVDLLKLRINSENQINSALLNRILETLFRFDVKTAPVIRPPFGVSILVIAMKPPRRDARSAVALASDHACP
jgi:hypothetical protein